MPRDLDRGERLGRYDLLLKIGRGGMASVWVAHEHAPRSEDSRIVAIKAIHSNLAEEPEFVAMFLDEGRLVQHIRHPNVVDLYEVGEADGVMYLAMEWVEGDSLHTLIAEAGRRRPIPPEMAVRIIADAAAGLHAAHELRDEAGNLLGVVHRDVSPQNILIGTSGRVKLVDFGVAKARSRIGEATEIGHVKGKFGYMSPEQALARPLDRRSDVFALGIVLYELTTGRRLFRGDSDADTLALVVQGEIPPLSRVVPGYPPALEGIVMKALSRSRRERFQTARDLQRALEKYLKDERIVVPRAGIAGLLRKVLGERIEARRQAVRAALRSVAAARDGLVPEDSAFRPVDPDTDAIPSGLSDLSNVDALGLSPSRVGQPTELTGSFVGPLPEAVRVEARRSRAIAIGGIAVGVLGMLVAGVALGVVAAGRSRGGGPASSAERPATAARAVPSTAASAAPSASSSANEATDDEAVAVDSLAPEAPDPPKRRGRR